MTISNTWMRPSNLQQRPVCIIGGGFQGRRIALMWASQDRPVIVFDTFAKSLETTQEYFDLESKSRKLGLLTTTSDLELATSTAWLVIEAIPEVLSLKRSIFALLETHAPRDAILATNSSSYRSAEIAEHIQSKHRVCNIHYFRPPEIVACEVMTSGETDQAVIDTLVEELKLHGHQPFLVQKESTGFIHNRVWAAIKRETLQVVAEGIAKPVDVDSLFKIRFKTPQGPFEIMDGVGLDVVLDIETHYAEERPHLPESPRQLLKKYVEAGRLGTKSGSGFFEWKDGTCSELPVLKME